MKIMQLSADQYEYVRHLFYDNYPNQPLVLGVIEGTLPGQIWVDDEKNPGSCLVMTEWPYCFIAGSPDQTILSDFIRLLNQKGDVKLVYELPVTDVAANLDRFGFSSVARRQYCYKNDVSIISQYENKSSYVLKQLTDVSMLDLCIWSSLVIGLCGTADNYLKYGLCFILWDEQTQQVVSEAHGIASKNSIEVGTMTRESYRGKGLSTIVVNALIQEARKRHLKPVWTCDEANVASWKVAEHQGMDEMTSYTFYKLHS